MTDTQKLPDPRPAAQTLPTGSAIILRHYDDPHREQLAKELRVITRTRRCYFLIAEDIGLAYHLRADGCHFPERASHRAATAKQKNPSWLVTCAAHTHTALVAAHRAKADAALLSPVFATSSHPSTHPLGPVRAAAMVQASPLPIYALGGMTEACFHRVKMAGFCDFAAIDSLAPDP